ncbi:MAG: hypothetical protein HKN79_07105, partial [Flavobacteriales bacterium]|nr:hypothetical protein [Flavobacteriales bacterium]
MVTLRSDRSYFIVILVTAVVLAGWTWALMASRGFDEDSLRILIRGTARSSAILFSLAFAASSVHHFVRSDITAVWLRWRPHLGLAFTVSHTVHLIFLILLQEYIHPVFTLAKATSLFAGGTAYLFMYLMALTTFTAIKIRISPWFWKYLHLIGSYWIWAIFFNSYLKNVINRGRYHGLLALLSIVMMLR